MFSSAAAGFVLICSFIIFSLTQKSIPHITPFTISSVGDGRKKLQVKGKMMQFKRKRCTLGVLWFVEQLFVIRNCFSKWCCLIGPIDPLIRHHFYHFKNCLSVALKDEENLKHSQLISYSNQNNCGIFLRPPTPVCYNLFMLG